MLTDPSADSFLRELVKIRARGESSLKLQSLEYLGLQPLSHLKVWALGVEPIRSRESRNKG
jgi:hypothetical protein